MRRDFGPKNYDRSYVGPRPDTSQYVEEGGRRPVPRDNKELLLRRFRERFFVAPERDGPEPFTDIELGSRNPENPLPITDYKQVITETIRQNPVTIIVAETGAGKSTQVPQYLLEAGYTVSMTQPRRLAANMLSDRIGEEVSEAIGNPHARDLVGLHTAERNTITDDTRITVLTDGLRLVQELNNRGDIENEVLIIDEVHEWNNNIEVLVAWTKKLVKAQPDMRIVLMSATMDAHRLAEYYSDVVATPPIIEVPGRPHDVDKIEEPSSTVLEQTIKYAKEGNNTLVFLPGVREIGDMQHALEEYFAEHGMDDVTVLPLHGKLSDQEQKAVDQFYPGPKIVLATNVAQTSLTIKDMDVVVDSGLERRVEIDEEGVQSLRLHAISQADSNQRAGRVGRTHPGTYVLTRLDSETDYVPYIRRDEYPMAEILRSDVDRNTLAVAAAGLDFSELDLFHPVDHDSLLRSRHRIALLGGVDGEGKITPRGRRMNEFPVHPTLSRMLVESENYTEEVRRYVSAMVASLEVGRLPSYLYTANKNWQSLTDEKESDHLAQLDIFIATQGIETNYELGRLGLDVRNVPRARELHDKISRREGMRPVELEPPTEEQRAEILECVVAGMIDFVYESSGRDTYTRALGTTATQRVISNRSVVRGAGSTTVVGWPYQYQHPREGEKYVLENVTTSGRIPETLGKVAASLCNWEDGQIKWRSGTPVVEQRQMFRDTIPTGVWREQAAEPSSEVRQAVLEYVTENPGSALRALRATKKELEKLRRLAGDKVRQVTQDDLRSYIERAAPEDITDPSLVDELLRRIIEEEGLSLDALVPLEQRNVIYENAPPSIEVDGVELPLRYSNGKVQSHVLDPGVVASLTREATLPDDRPIQLMYNKKPHTLDQLKAMV
jgi:HrpA-like RNA helicase